ncbi:zinc finger, DHHC-type containing 12 [Cichlidogyrus casuarinus]|uniref:Zinc finger, DHHC-type containing 12 n=1 Tax=Cichlidogyrus casuarinus TaxID=1844966 RepID=A0ABD2PT64_9PLAT
MCFMTLIMGGVPATGLFIFHLYLMTTGITTWELVSRSHISYLRDLPLDMNPFDKGCFRNCFFFLCRTYPVGWNQIYCDATAQLLRKKRKAAKKKAKKQANVNSFPAVPENQTVDGPLPSSKVWMTSEDMKTHILKSTDYSMKHSTNMVHTSLDSYA